MAWVVGLIAALFGSVFAEEASWLFGLLAGFALGHGWISRNRLRHRIDALEARLDRQRQPMPRTADPVPEAPQSAPPAESAPRVDSGPEIVREPAASTTSPPLPSAEAVQVSPAATDIPNEARPSPPPIPPRPTPREPTGPSLVDRLRTFFFEGNVPVKLGLLLSLFGVAALIKLAAEQGWLVIPVSVRLAMVAAAGLALTLYGLREAKPRPAFGLSLQGGGIAILLLTTFGAYRLWHQLPASAAFICVALLVAGAAVLAIRQNAVWLAVIGFLGGYLAPILLSTGSGNHVALFSYYAVLNLAVFAMAWIRPWRPLHLIGFVFTFGVGAIWGMRYFRPELFWTVEPFLIGFFLLYLAIPLLYAQRGDHPGKVDATLLFGTPLIAFPMQVGLLESERLPLAFSAVAVGGIYAALAWRANRDTRLRDFAQSAAVMGLAFAVLAVPLALSARWTSTTWALQGVALLWLGLRQQRRWPQLAGVLLQVLAGGAYLAAFDSDSDTQAIFNAHTLNLLVLALSAFACSRLLQNSDGMRRATALLLFTLGATWWTWLGLREVVINLDAWPNVIGALLLGFVAITAALGRLAWQRFDMPWLRSLIAGYLLASPLLVIIATFERDHWLLQAHGLYLLAMLAAAAFALPAFGDARRRQALAHLGGLGSLALGAGIALWMQLADQPEYVLGEGWGYLLPFAPLMALTVGLVVRPQWAAWPVPTAFANYRLWLLGPFAAALALLWLGTQALAGYSAPLPWLPIANPLELFHWGAVLAVLLAARANPRLASPLQVLAAGMSWCVLSLMTLRICHLWLGEGWLPDVWFSAVGQTALSIVWASAGVTLWILGSRRRQWGLWLLGALLLGVVVAKLGLVDRRSLSDVEGVASFLVVGALFLIVGRLAPIPPRRSDATVSEISS